LWDSSAILALLDASDAFHLAAKKAEQKLAAEGRTAFVTNYLEVETHALLLARLGRGAARTWLLEGRMFVERVVSADEARAREMISQYADKDWSLCDAISFAFMERTAVKTAFTFDRHFRQFGRFELLGLPAA
jgi:predicted nucleic acid-binding protein